jgi:hypothetical protein
MDGESQPGTQDIADIADDIHDLGALEAFFPNLGDHLPIHARLFAHGQGGKGQKDNRRQYSSSKISHGRPPHDIILLQSQPLEPCELELVVIEGKRKIHAGNEKVNLEGKTPSNGRLEDPAALPPLIGRRMKPRPATKGAAPPWNPLERFPVASHRAYEPLVNEKRN